MDDKDKEVQSTPPVDVPPYDPVLGLYIDLVELGEPLEKEISVTLSMGGMMISGDIVSADEYLELTGMQKVLDAINPDEKFEKLWLMPRRFIHLKNALFFLGAGEGIPNDQPIYWRGRLAEISGFTLGKLASSRPRI
jgi:hypothetical protein